ncbi:MAG TPA: sugar ABC transporter permease, partial [Lactobacillus sp.]|nr:sugar ABC transporter permease [Lactobacillus sp.]
MGEKNNRNFWSYLLLVSGGILILLPLLYTVLSSFKTTKQIMDNF